MYEWTEPITRFCGQKLDELWVWFDTLSRGEWLIVLATCCAVGFVLLKGWGNRGPC